MKYLAVLTVKYATGVEAVANLPFENAGPPSLADVKALEESATFQCEALGAVLTNIIQLAD